MKTHNTKFFSEPEVTRIEDAVRKAEEETSGEIVPYVVQRSDDYEEAEWRAAFLSIVLYLAVMIGLHQFTDLWLPFGIVTLSFGALAIGLLAVLTLRAIPSLKRLLAGGGVMDDRVASKAAEAFLAEEIFKTKDRTGILIFISILEHRVHVMGDAGINSRVPSDAWKDVVRDIVQGIKSGHATDGLVTAIGKCGNLLKKKGVEREPDDRNEVPNKVRQK